MKREEFREVLWRCSRCQLIFGWERDEIPHQCPQCRRGGRVNDRIKIERWRRDITDYIVREYGARDGLLEPEFHRRFNKYRMGTCPHGWITPAICGECTV